MIETLTNPHNVAAVLIAIAVAATIITVAQPFLWTDRLDKRLKAVASERERIRRREREKMVVQKASLKFEPKAYMKQIVDNLNLSKWLGTDQAKSKMASAGFRGSGAETTFLFFRLVTPVVLVVVGALYIFVILDVQWPLPLRFVAVMACAYIGIKAPEMYISNVIAKRYKSISRAFPDAMDLLLICVESGMSIEQAFRKVGVEIGVQSIPLAEELTLTTAELSYLPDRRSAYENLANRVKTESVKQIATVLIQAERYGTPLGSALRVLGQESRDHRMLLAEQKAAALPPKLTVPMIIFFLPVLFAVILTPAIIQITATFGG